MRTKITVGLLSLLSLTCAPCIWGGSIYSTLPDPSLPDEFSLGYQDNAINEFGDLVELSTAPAIINLESAVVALSNWAFESAYERVGTSAGYFLPITLNLYNVGPGDSLGPLFASVTTTAFVPWRQEPDALDCGPGSTDYQASDGGCYPGALLTVAFNLVGISAPDTLIYGLTFNTQDSGYNPYFIPGPYDALQLAMSGDPPTAGSNPLPDTVFWNTSIAGNYHDGGLGGVDVFRPDQGWAPFSPAIEFSSAPEPSTWGLTVTFVLGFCGIRIRRASHQGLAALRRKRTQRLGDGFRVRP